MNFYQNWAETMRNGLDDSEHIKIFLDCKNDAVDCLVDGEKEDVVIVRSRGAICICNRS